MSKVTLSNGKKCRIWTDDELQIVMECLNREREAMMGSLPDCDMYERRAVKAELKLLDSAYGKIVDVE